ncbi:MSMEG_0568 family radical SAM protein [Pseudomonas typographi]|uniref:MSMEG_0568 family radical SAM protein n=1 Tax=Pseudomonas typographi TaxID=2715964 RepID=A0ABR7Z3S3_9PSED|nr:MSMEG_0568 family radical SAM protein [Pseudomonas typographi]MBD1552708.1 MSMEG_0568 family radical SAM protein [Pseudomonas typographi]MBD1588189.1 MSMEG_0568 family radical SAM protein [Pseudomonas typographi]MBD1600160.1 MSMEG_0568 family radical SAM protein [Pseudomonas typographi]
MVDLAQHLLSELQCHGLRWQGDGGLARKGGAGPSDHKALTLGEHTAMVPMLNQASLQSPYHAVPDAAGEHALIFREGQALGRVALPAVPKFYALATADGIPYRKIATLHSRDVLATTVLQHCIRLNQAESACQFCAIGQSLASGNTIARKRPAQLAEVAEAAVRLDGVKHMVMTTGTPNTPDRGAAILCESAAAVSAVVALPIQAQCEPPDDDSWFIRLKQAGVVSLGMHLEAVTDAVRAKIMPGKAQVPLARYFSAFEAAVKVFGHGQVSTYILAGLGDSQDAIAQMSERLAAMGVYPFVVPFVPIDGTPLAGHPKPSSEFMQALYPRIGQSLRRHGLHSANIHAGCAKCGACSALRQHE